MARTLGLLSFALGLCGLSGEVTAQSTQPACKYPTVSLHAKSPFNVWWTLWDPSVIWDEQGKVFRLVYTRWNPKTKHMHVYGTESADGITWNRPIRDLIDPTMEGQGWGEGVIDNFETTSLVQINASTFYLYFCGYVHAKRVEKIGLAISTDFGKTYKVYKGNPVLVPTQPWEGTGTTGIKEPSVIWDRSAGLFKIWYNVTTYGKVTRVGYAWSKDGIHWTKHANNPVMHHLPKKTGWEWAGEVNHVNVVKDPSYGYHLFYANHFAIGQAWSADGVSWIRDPSTKPVIDYSYKSAYKTSTGAWEFVDLEAYGSPAAIFKDNKLWLFHMRTLPGAYKYGKASKQSQQTNPGYFGMNLGIAVGSCTFASGKAALFPIGKGHGSSLGVPSMSAGNPVLGKTMTLNGAGCEPASQYAVTFLGLPSPGLRIPKGGELYIAMPILPFGSALVSSSGTWSMPVAIPTSVSLVGVELGLQALVAPTTSALGYSTSNGLHLLLGH